jgi:hypothetical protein
MPRHEGQRPHPARSRLRPSVRSRRCARRSRPPGRSGLPIMASRATGVAAPGRALARTKATAATLAAARAAGAAARDRTAAPDRMAPDRAAARRKAMAATLAAATRAAATQAPVPAKAATATLAVGATATAKKAKGRVTTKAKKGEGWATRAKAGRRAVKAAIGVRARAENQPVRQANRVAAGVTATTAVVATGRAPAKEAVRLAMGTASREREVGSRDQRQARPAYRTPRRTAPPEPPPPSPWLRHRRRLRRTARPRFLR